MSEVIEAFRSVDSVLLVMATGTGKTFTAAEIIRQRLPMGRILWIAHRKELLDQAREALETLTGVSTELEKADSYASPFGQSRIVVASIQSMQRRRLERWPKNAFHTVVIDECFPGWTMVDTPEGPVAIEDLSPGDRVITVCHETGEVEAKPVISVSRREEAALVAVCHERGTVYCTGNHPFFVKGRGYVEAQALKAGDVLCVWQSIRDDEQGDGRQDLLDRVSPQDLVGDYGAHEPKVRIGPNEAKQSHGSTRDPGQGFGDTKAHRPQSDCSGRKWTGPHEARGGAPEGAGAGLAMAIRRRHENAARVRVPDQLQARFGEPREQDRYRGGRGQPRRASAPGTRPEERRVLKWARVDGVADIKRRGAFPVYNLHVEGNHTYFADNTLVHNCHHAPSKTYRHLLQYFTNCKVLGLTATPDRLDEVGLGALFEVCAYEYGIADGITDGYLCPIVQKRVVCADLDISDVRTVAGDLNQGQLADVLKVDGVLHQMADPMVEVTKNRKTLIFTVSVDQAHALARVMSGYVSADSVEAVDGTTPAKRRDDVVRDFRHGSLQYLINCAVYTEGFDAPETACVAVARPTKSRSLYSQMIGRGTRIAPGKDDCLVLDFVGNSGKHRLIGPLDVLAGKPLSDLEHQIAQDLIDKQNKPTLLAVVEAQQEAERRHKAELERRRRSKGMQVDVAYQMLATDPFGFLDVQRVNAPPATSKQLDFIEKMGVKLNKDMPNIREASQMIDSLTKRRKKGLCTYKQARILAKNGLPHDVSFSEAKAIIDVIASHRWRPPPKVLQGLRDRYEVSDG